MDEVKKRKEVTAKTPKMRKGSKELMMIGSLCILSEELCDFAVNHKKMIKQLRKRHLQIWMLWAILLPVGIVVAYLSVPEKVTQELLQPPVKTNSFPIKAIDSLNFKTLRQ